MNVAQIRISSNSKRTLAMSKKERLTDEELFAQLEGLGEDAGSKDGVPSSGGDQKSEADLLAELELPERPKSSGRPHTPRTSTPGLASKGTPKRTGTATPTSNDGARSSEERAQQRKSGDSSRSFHNSFTPASSGEGDNEPERSTTTVPEAVQEQSSGGGWWGSVFSTASAAVKQAEALAKEIRQNEEAQRWAEQVRGNVGALRGLGMVFNSVLYRYSSSDLLHRRRTSLTRTPNLYRYPPHPSSTDILSRTSSNPHHA